MAIKHRGRRIWVKILIGILGFLGGAAIIWFSMVYFESEVIGNRAPYLQMAGPQRMSIRWSSASKGVGEVYFGTSPGQLDQHRRETHRGTNHRVVLRYLRPATRYYYRVKQGGKWRMPTPAWFNTSPLPGNQAPTRIWVIGDPGETGQVHFVVSRNAHKWFEAHARPNLPLLDFILTTGDNAYPNATNAQYSSGFFKPFANFLENFTVWPVYGNHDARRWAFYKIFDRPADGQMGGVPSHTQEYFSFDYNRVHVIILDSEHGDFSPSGPMLTWLKRDLKQTRQKWVIVAFHHPPYSKGTHDSDNPHDSHGRMIKVRENIVPILDRAGVDLVLSGHSHDYERSDLIHCSYGFSSSFKPWMITDRGVKGADGVTHYRKAHAGLSPYSGTMYLVEGSSGQGNKVKHLHPVMVADSGRPGSVILDIRGESLEGRYLDEAGQVTDTFTITKGVNPSAPVGNCKP